MNNNLCISNAVDKHIQNVVVEYTDVGIWVS